MESDFHALEINLHFRVEHVSDAHPINLIQGVSLLLTLHDGLEVALHMREQMIAMQRSFQQTILELRKQIK